MLYLFEISHDTRIQSVVVVFGEPHVEEIVLVFDLGQSDGRQPGEDQWQQNEDNVMSERKVFRYLTSSANRRYSH